MRDSKHNPLFMSAAAAGLVCCSVAMSPDKTIFALAAGLSLFGSGYGYFNKEFPKNTYIFCSTLASAVAISADFFASQKWVDALSILACGFIGAEFGKFLQDEAKQTSVTNR